MKEETIATLAGAVVGALIGVAVTWFCTRSTNKLQERLAKENLKAQERSFLDAMLLKMLEFMMEYPYVEQEHYCGKYPDIAADAKSKERYETYCIFVFNFLQRAFRHFDNDGARFRDYIHLEEIVLNHHRWWQADTQNLHYDEPFQQCIQGCINELRKREKIK